MTCVSTNVTGRNYGTHIDGEAGKTLCKRYVLRDVNRGGPGEEAQASCKPCQKAYSKAQEAAEKGLLKLRRQRALNGKRIRAVLLDECDTCGRATTRYRFVCSALCIHWLCTTCHDAALHG